MKEKIIPDDIKNKSLKELREMISSLIQNIETRTDLENYHEDYQKLIKLNNMIEKKFQFESKKILQSTKEKIEKIKNKNEKSDI